MIILMNNNENCLASLLPFVQGLVHSYREAFEDMEADGFARSAPYCSDVGGGENSPQTPRFPVSPQTPYFNMCRFTLNRM